MQMALSGEHGRALGALVGMPARGVGVGVGGWSGEHIEARGMLYHVPSTCPDDSLSLQPVQAALGVVPGKSHGAVGRGPTRSLCLGLAKVHPPTECEVGLPSCVLAFWCSSGVLSVSLTMPSIPSIMCCRRNRGRSLCTALHREVTKVFT